MSVLETFFYLFDADARKLEEGLKDADRASDKLKKGLDETDVVAGKVGATMLKLAYRVGTAIGSIFAVGALATMTLEVADFTDNMGDAAEAIGVAVDELHAWELANVAADGTQGAFTASLNQFNIGLQDIATKGKGRLLPFLKELGLSMKDVEEGSKDPISALLKMSDTFAKLSKAEAAGLGAKIGLDQGTINLLTKGRKGVEELLVQQREFGVITKEDAEKAAKLDEQMKAWNNTFATIKREIAMTLIPPLTWFFEKLRGVVKWMSENRTLVITFFGSIAAVIVGLLVPSLLAGAAAARTFILRFLPIIAAVAAFGAILGLIVDDIYNFQQGNDSVIGELAKKWPIIGDVIRGVADVLLFFMETARALFAAFVTLVTDGPQAAIEGFGNAVRAVVADISSRFPIVGEIFDTLTGGMASGIEAVVKIWQWLVDKVSAGIELFMRGVSIVKGLHGAGARLLGFGYAERPEETATPSAAAPASAASRRRAILNVGTGAVTPAAERRPAAVGGATPEGRAIRAGVEAGRRQISATASPIVSQSSNAIANSTDNRTTTKQTNVTVERVDVHTQAADGPAVANAIGDRLGNELRGAIDQNDDGVAA